MVETYKVDLSFLSTWFKKINRYERTEDYLIRNFKYLSFSDVIEDYLKYMEERGLEVNLDKLVKFSLTLRYVIVKIVNKLVYNLIDVKVKNCVIMDDKIYVELEAVYEE